jgi:hypothetical protein
VYRGVVSRGAKQCTEDGKSTYRSHACPLRDGTAAAAVGRRQPHQQWSQRLSGPQRRGMLAAEGQIAQSLKSKALDFSRATLCRLLHTVCQNDVRISYNVYRMLVSKVTCLHSLSQSGECLTAVCSWLTDDAYKTSMAVPEVAAQTTNRFLSDES